MNSTLRSLFAPVLSVLLLCSTGFILGGCSSGEIDENDPTILMKEANEDIESSRYMIALEKLQKLKNEHPYSKEATEAALRIADVYFMQDNFAEAAATYEAFKDLHPKHPRFEYAAYRIGLAYYSDIPSVHARDLTSAFKAEEGFNDYLFKFPNGEFSKDAREKLADARKTLAEKEMYIGNFYFKRKMWEAAKGRFTKVVNQYSESPYLEEAKTKLVDIESKPPEEAEKK
jgi:outer membrane protein assembly factor BamD